jgi:hypothetical protein
VATETGVYVYALARDLPGDTVERTQGVGGAPVRVIAHEGVQALVSTVDLAEFGEEALRRNLEDLGWLEDTARGHNTVVANAAALAVTLPMRLLTVYRSDERVREELRDRREEFAEAFGRIGGRREWGVKAFAELRDLMAADPAAEDADAARPGTSYLRRRRAERRTEEEARHEAMRRAAEIDTRLSEIAVARHLHPPQNPELSGHRGLMILNASYLVDDERVEEFRKAVASLGGLRGISAQLSGPWAPYSFAMEEEPWTAR